ncbi:uncharacterized protein BO66DRAFT_101917 [Aspergillus aculeatinus CBS 121060]|uniref:Uncharacterized protein n=1 Tax=Aspergillus aculeatinus CBS 121060 TaxID=1448322 RepID=A0ACD1H7I9_9EURO|nr:hypothetical protein BO66DRAFT_101917 [Aspergillus aculeatinus CBS 121060]RAH69517.1 hypothetical protein BO66DRAFT_101917 [Aspergillus aculeatinus CBS 121060]
MDGKMVNPCLDVASPSLLLLGPKAQDPPHSITRYLLRGVSLGQVVNNPLVTNSYAANPHCRSFHFDNPACPSGPVVDEPCAPSMSPATPAKSS